MKAAVKWLVISFAFVFILSFSGQLTKIHQLEGIIATLKADKEIAHIENNELKEDIVLLQDLSYIEILARERLSMIYPGEERYIDATVDPEVLPKSEIEREILE